MTEKNKEVARWFFQGPSSDVSPKTVRVFFFFGFTGNKNNTHQGVFFAQQNILVTFWPMTATFRERIMRGAAIRDRARLEP